MHLEDTKNHEGFSVNRKNTSPPSENFWIISAGRR